MHCYIGLKTIHFILMLYRIFFQCVQLSGIEKENMFTKLRFFPVYPTIVFHYYWRAVGNLWFHQKPHWLHRRYLEIEFSWVTTFNIFLFPMKIIVLSTTVSMRIFTAINFYTKYLLFVPYTTFHIHFLPIDPAGGSLWTPP